MVNIKFFFSIIKKKSNDKTVGKFNLYYNNLYLIHFYYLK